MNDTINQTLNQTIISNINDTTNSSLLFMGQTFPITSSPTYDIILITIVAALFITLVNKYLSDQVKIKALRSEMKDLQKKMRKLMSKDPAKAKKMQGEIMKKNMENMKHAMNPKIMLITMVPLLGVFMFVSKYYSQFGEFFTPFNGFVMWGWLGTYIFFSIISSIIMKKVLDVA